MTGEWLSSPASLKVRSIGTFLLMLAPAAILLGVGRWSALEGNVRFRDHAGGAREWIRTESNGAGRLGAGTSLTWEDLKDYPFARRADFVAAMRQLLIRLRQHFPASGASPRTEAVHEAQGRMQAELDSLNLATNRNWETAKQEVGEAWRHLRQLCRDTDAPMHP